MLPGRPQCSSVCPTSYFPEQSIEFASIAPIFVYNVIISINVNNVQSDFQS